jgi:glycosyltransferase involved in cell wall biosynthesis
MQRRGPGVIAVPSGNDQHDQSITCLCITRHRPHLLKRSIFCFDQQTHRQRNLLIIAETEDLATAEVLTSMKHRSDVRVIYVDSSTELTLGALRNLSVSAATGRFVAQWDDDDFYHPQRLACQLAELHRLRRHACVLRRLLLVKNQMTFLSKARDWEGSLVCRRTEMPRYHDLRRAEDTPVIERLAASGQLVRYDRPDLYVYQYHGANTWDEQHWDEMIARSTEQADEPRYPIMKLVKMYNEAQPSQSGAGEAFNIPAICR